MVAEYKVELHHCKVKKKLWEGGGGRRIMGRWEWQEDYGKVD